MARLGFPAISVPRAPDTARDAQIAIANIRERLQTLEVFVTTLQGGSVDLSGIQRQISRLQTDLQALTNRVATLEAESPTDWYVDGIFIGTRHVANFIHGAGLTITGTDNETNQRVDIRFDAAGVNLTLPVAPSSLRITGRDVAMSVGRFITATRASLIVTGRSVGLTLSSDLIIRASRATLRLTGRDVGMTLSSNFMLPASRANLRLTGRDAAMNLSSNFALPATRANLRLTGRDAPMSLSAILSLPVTRANLRVTGRSVGMSPVLDTQRASLRLTGRDAPMQYPTFTFFRNFVDLSTSGLTVYKGTVSAATGELQGTPTNGGVHERVYFNTLPPGSPTAISGAFDLTAHIHIINTTTNSSAVTFFIQNDDGSAGTIQNGYWVDVAVQLNAIRLIRFVSGSGIQRGSVALGMTSGTLTLRVTCDGAGNFSVYKNGALGFSVSSETTFTSGQFGIAYFANPGTGYAFIDYGINYVA